MSRRQFIFNWVLALIIGLFILPSILNWLGMPFSFSNVLHWVFGEPNLINRVIVLILTILLLVIVGRGVYKDYKKLT